MPTPTAHIPLPYRLFHLYIEPLLLVPGGIYLSLFQPRQFLFSTCPAPIAAPYAPSLHEPAPITPLVQQLLTNTAALYLLFMINEVLVLRLSSDVGVWRAVVFAMLCCDVLHLYAVWVAGGPEFMLSLGQWRVEDWGNTCILAAGAVLRVLFLGGVGVKEVKEDGAGRVGKRE